MNLDDLVVKFKVVIKHKPVVTPRAISNEVVLFHEDFETFFDVHTYNSVYLKINDT